MSDERRGAWWTLPNVVTGLLIAASALFPRSPVFSSDTMHTLVDLALLAVVVTPFIAVFVDGRRGTGVWLVGSAVLTGLGVLALFMQTESWRHDDGLGQGFTLLFLAIGGGLYTLAVFVLFGVRHLVRRWRVTSENL